MDLESLLHNNRVTNLLYRYIFAYCDRSEGHTGVIVERSVISFKWKYFKSKYKEVLERIEDAR